MNRRKLVIPVLLLVVLLACLVWQQSTPPTGVEPEVVPTAETADGPMRKRRDHPARQAEEEDASQAPPDAPEPDSPANASELAFYTQSGDPEVTVRQARGTLRGRVLDHEQQPVAGARMSLSSSWVPQNVQRQTRRHMGHAWARGETEADGTFALPYVHGGELRLSVQGEVPSMGGGGRSALPSKRELTRPGWHGVIADPSVWQRIVLSPLDAADVRVIVVDQAGAALPGAQVRVRSPHTFWFGLGYTEGERGSTDESGVFVARDTRAGRAPVSVDLAGYELVQDRMIDVPLQGEVEVRVELGRGVTVSGRVVDAETGAPIADAAVWPTPSNTSPRPERARADADGRFDVTRLPFVRQRGSLCFSAPGYATALRSVRARADGEVVPLNVPLVRPAELKVRCVNAVGGPLPGVLVVVNSAQRDPSPGTRSYRDQIRTSWTGPDGAARVEGLPPGPEPPTVTFYLDAVPVLELAGPVLEARVTTDLGDVVLTAGGSLRGVVRLADGAPAKGTYVVLARADPSDPRREVLGNSATWPGDTPYAWVQADGSFHVAGLGPGTWDLLAFGERRPPLLHPGIVVPVDGDPSRLELRLPRSVPIEGVLRDAQGRPLADHVVGALRREPVDFNLMETTRTDEGGRFSIPGFTDDLARVWLAVELPPDDRGNRTEIGRWVVPREGPLDVRIDRLGSRPDDLTD